MLVGLVLGGFPDAADNAAPAVPAIGSPWTAAPAGPPAIPQVPPSGALPGPYQSAPLLPPEQPSATAALPGRPASDALPSLDSVEGNPESSWYARVDYYHWHEQFQGASFVDESGPLFTVGYARRWDHDRCRIELFGGDEDYSGAVQGGADNGDSLPGTTRYLGAGANSNT